ncbi:MAG TPA: RidA family protein [Rectinemataceae bacterium]|nr:RidA family protein [Rectinemataceae bacterium]
MQLTSITSPEAPKALGPYSQAVSVGDFVFCSGQLGIVPSSGELADGVKAQADQAMRNLRAVLAAAGSGLDRIVKTTIFLADMADFAVVNEVYGSFFKGAFPARSTVQVAALPKAGRVEIEAIALSGRS